MFKVLSVHVHCCAKHMLTLCRSYVGSLMSLLT